MGHPDDSGPQYFALKIETLHFGVDSEGSDDVLERLHAHETTGAGAVAGARRDVEDP